MYFKRKLLTLFFLFGSFSLIAQSVSEEAKLTLPSEKDYWSIRWAPLSLIEPHTPSLRLNTEYIPSRFNHKFGFKLDLGYGLEELKRKGDASKPKEFSMEYRTEVKYFPKADLDKWHYFSAELFFIDHNIGKSSGNGLDINGDVIEYEISAVAINTLGMNAKMGKNFYFSSRDLILDLYFGLGVRLIDVNSDPVDTSEIQPESNDYMRGISLIPDPSDIPGLRILPNISAGIQFGFNL